jgi:hypothetical protein
MEFLDSDLSVSIHLSKVTEEILEAGWREHLEDAALCDFAQMINERLQLEASRLPVSDTGRRRWRGYRGSAGDSSPRDWLALDHRECRGRLVALGR